MSTNTTSTSTCSTGSRNKNIHSTRTTSTSANAIISGVNHHNHHTNTTTTTTTGSSTGDTNNGTKEMIQTFQSKAKDMEQRLAAAIVQQQQILSYQKNTTTTTTTTTTTSTSNNKGSTSSSSNKKNNKNQDTLAVQQQQQQQIISKNINRYRMVLCETYGDWILTSPNTAVQYDIMNALWRSCFYGRIGPARIRIQKEQKKYDTLLLNQMTTTATTSNNTSTNTTNTNTSSMLTAMAKSLQQQKESLHLFLKEGITLYEYLCHTLQHQLIQQQQNVVLVPQDENRTMNDDHHHHQDQEELAVPSNGIVPCLYRLYIHLGDLYRYGDTNHTMSMASASYIKAMRLGPAYGHAYNQLAVIYQTKDTSTTTTTTTTTKATSSLSNKNQNNTITTVYWYTRSLGAAQEPFVTASSNLIRLFDSNRQWLQQQEQNQNKKILFRPDASANSNNNSKSKNDSDEKMPSTKVVPTNQSNTSRLCLSNFVDIQYTIFVDSMAKDNEKNHHHHHHHHHQQPSDTLHLQSLTNQIRTTMTSMQELLNNSSFSDSLLCKLITILAFMEYHCHIHDASKSSSSLLHTTTSTTTNNMNPARRMTLRKLVRNIMYELGDYMAERVHRTLMNKLQQQQQLQHFDKVATGITTLNSTTTTTTTTKTTTSNTTIPSVRVLLPLLLLTEYLLHNDTDDDMDPRFGESGQQERFTKGNNDDNDSEQEKYQSAYKIYWKKIIDVYNDILSLNCICHTNHDTHKTHPQQPIELTTQLQEYQELRGFLPFESFLKKRYCRHNDDENDNYLNDAGYLSDTATMQMMDTLLDRKGAVMTTNNNNPHRTTQESSFSTRITSQGSFSTNISVSSSTTNNSKSNGKEAMLMKLQRFIALRTRFVSRLQRHVRVHHTSDALVWVDDNDKNDEYHNFNADTTMQYNRRDFAMDQIRYNDDDDGGDRIVAMMDENEGTIQAISRLVADENTTSATINDRSRTDDVLLIYQHNDENDGPALLVPGAMLFESSEKVPATNDPNLFQPPGMSVVPASMPNKAAMSTSFNSLFDDNAYNINHKSMNEAKAGPTITPPPGFASTVAGSTAINSNLNPFMKSSYDGASVGVGMIKMYGNPISKKSNDINDWSGAAIPHSTTPPSTIGQSMLLFGGPTALQTANPFAAESNDSRLFVDNTVAASTTRHYLPSYQTTGNDTDLMFGSTTSQSPDYDALLFHSGLLKSLLMEETTTGGQQQEPTKNPFAG